jgi:CHAD domain-containing protein
MRSPALGKEVASGLSTACQRFERRFRQCRKKPSENRVHALRIEARRLLSILDLLAKSVPAPKLEKIRRAAKKKLNALDELRDVHVQTVAVLRLSREFPGLKPVYKNLRKREDVLARAARKKMKRMSLEKLLKRLDRLEDCYAKSHRGKESRASAIIRSAVTTAFANTIRLRRAINPHLTDSIHCTRIAFKKFRYMIEALRSLRREAGAQRLKAMQQYQTRMGEIQDMEVLLGRLEKFTKNHPELQITIQPTIAELARRHDQLVGNYMACADELYSFWSASRRQPSAPDVPA